MNYFSLTNPTIKTSFSEAVINGIAPDRGLYFPSEIPQLAKEFISEIPQMDIATMGAQIMAPFVAGDIPYSVLEKIIQNTLDFDFPVVPITEEVGCLELFHGPTLAFKDVGARFMAQSLGYFNQQKSKQKITVLVATSGDTGGAVANGFLGVEGIEVVILYPKGKVSKVQEQQLTTLGQNITALEVEGVFDDCQDMVKTAFLDQDITSKRKLTSANSINVARWLPQMLYYFLAYRQLEDKKQPLVFSVPSGNFGNICSGMIGQQMGLHIDHFVACTNVNDSVPTYLKTENYQAVKTTPTISNAMDVGDPSNFIRIQKIYKNDFQTLKNHLSGFRYTDDMTREAMKELYHQNGYIADPHGAVGYLGLKEYLAKKPSAYGVFLETAHPVKFLDTVEDTLDIEVPMPDRIQSLLAKEKKSTAIKNYDELKEFLTA